VNVKERIVLDVVQDRSSLPNVPTDAPRPNRLEPDERAPEHHYTPDCTTARPKGVQLTHRNCWLNAVIFGWHTTLPDRDCCKITNPFRRCSHCNGWAA